MEEFKSTYDQEVRHFSRIYVLLAFVASVLNFLIVLYVAAFVMPQVSVVSSQTDKILRDVQEIQQHTAEIRRSMDINIPQMEHVKATTEKILVNVASISKEVERTQAAVSVNKKLLEDARLAAIKTNEVTSEVQRQMQKALATLQPKGKP